jgi:hypothetical protein
MPMKLHTNNRYHELHKTKILILKISERKEYETPVEYSHTGLSKIKVF